MSIMKKIGINGSLEEGLPMTSGQGRAEQTLYSNTEGVTSEGGQESRVFMLRKQQVPRCGFGEPPGSVQGVLGALLWWQVADCCVCGRMWR